MGRKIGMTRIFTDDGNAVPVTVLDVANNRVTQIKTQETDGYSAVQVTFGKRRASRVAKPQAGHLAKAGVEAGELLREFPVKPEQLAELKVGGVIGVDTFKVGELVDVTGTTKGRGFTGSMVRWNFAGLEASHGVSVAHRSHGSTGQRQDPGRTFKNKKMAGHYGAERVTTQNLKIVQTDVERGLIYIHGCVPGAEGSYVLVRDAMRQKRPADAPYPAALLSAASAAAPDAATPPEEKKE